jgi:para-nitrobenzyl esterase
LLVAAVVTGLLAVHGVTATAGASSVAGAPGAIVATDRGRIRGFVGEGVLEFRGIPYAAPPVGERRWTSPAQVEPWDGVRDATHYRDACPQVVRYALTDASEVEDCLYLNVAVPARPARNGGPRAVLVWIHGGIFVGGSSNLYPLDYHARTGDLVVVSINYRLGALGFLSHPALPADRAGGYALEDQRAALRWVQRNISAFGGDPANVTLAGESAGAHSVCMHLITPEETQGLFHRAIMQSGPCARRLPTTQEAEAVGLQVAERVGCTDPATAAACLRAVPVKALLVAQTAITASNLIAFAPSVGSKTLPRQGREALETGRIVRVPILNGGDRDEMRLFIGYDVVAGRVITAANYPEVIGAIYGEHAAAVLGHYPVAAYSSAPAALGTVLSDFQPAGMLPNCSFLETARLAARTVPVYEFEFTDRAAPPVMDDPGFEQGAVHSAELPYLFPHFSNKTVLDGPDLAPGAQRLSEQMVRYWAAFARLGRPAVKGLPAWPRFSSARDVLRLHPGKVGVFDAGAMHQCSFWRSLYPNEFGG